MTAPTRSTGEPRLASVASWAVLTASFGLSASTWIALGVLAGFTSTIIVHGVTLFRLAWLMPIAVDGYVVVALVLWMAPVPARVAAFAKKNTYLAAGTGIAAQSAYHLLFTLSTTNQWWRVVLAALVGALPPTVAGLAVHMRALIRRESGNTNPIAVPVPAARPSMPTPAPTALPQLSAVDARPTQPTTPTGPAPTPTPVPVPSPAQVAARITPPRPTVQAAPAAEPRPAARPARPRPTALKTTAAPLAPPATDFSVNAQDAAQLALPIVSPELLARATSVARQYLAENGTPITAGQLAVRLTVSSDLATHLLASVDLDSNDPTAPVPTVNGARTGATR